MSFIDRLGIHLIQKNPELIERNVDRSLGVLSFALQQMVSLELRTTRTENQPLTEVNENFRPAIEIIKSAVARYQQEFGQDPTWQRSPNHLDLREFSNTLNQPFNYAQYMMIAVATLDSRDEVAIKKFEEKFGTAEHPKQITFGEAIQKAIDQGARREVLVSLILGELGEKSQALSDAEDYAVSATVIKINQRRERSSQPELTEEDFTNEIYELKQIVEDQQQRTGEPVSVQEVLYELLKKFEGSLNDSLAALNSFLKYVSRNMNPGQHMDGETQMLYQANWVRKNIKDEFSPVLSFNILPETGQLLDEHIGRPWLYGKIMKVFTGLSQPEKFDPRYNLLNRIGTPYHVINLIELLQDCSPEVIMAAAAQEYMTSGQSHGSVKALADVMLLKNLRSIDNYLQQFSKDLS